jgi:hypothetical protein
MTQPEITVDQKAILIDLLKGILTKDQRDEMLYQYWLSKYIAKDPKAQRILARVILIQELNEEMEQL